MIDEIKLRHLQRLGLIVAAIVLLLIGYGLGASLHQNENKVKERPTQTTKKVEGKSLTQNKVKDFLIAFYTKKDLGENRNRYKPFMTSSMYQSELSLEDDATNQAYKGYVVDFKYKDSEIYIDAKNNVALVKVRYTNTLLSKKGDYSKAQKNVSNEATVKLSYLQDGKKLLVNHVDSILITSSDGTDSDYPDYGKLQSSQITENTETHHDVSNDTPIEGEENNG